MTTDLHAQLAEYGRSQRANRLAVDLAEITSSATASTMTPESPLIRPAETDVCETCGADLMVFDLRGPVEIPEHRPRRRPAAVLAVAAAILLVVGVVVIPDQDDNNVETEPVSSATTPEPVPSPTLPEPTPLPEEPGLPSSVVDSLGYRWSRVPHDEAVFGGEGWRAMKDVTAGGPGLVAVGEAIAVWDGEDYREGDAVVWTSVDGLTWSRVPHVEAVFGGDGDNWMHTVIAGGPGLVAIGRIDDSNSEEGPTAIWTSVDGITWTRHEDAFNGSGPLDGTVPGPGLVLVGEVDQGAAVWTSADGITWSRVPHDQEVFGDKAGDGNGMSGVTLGGPGFVAVGSDGVNSHNPTGRGHAIVWTSVDGLTWSRVPHDETVFGGPGDQAMFDVTVGGPGLVAVGEDAQGAPVWTSTDGITWTQVPDPGEVFGGPSQTGTYGQALVYEVVAGGLGLMAFGEELGVGAMWTSVDGLTWKREEAFAPYQAGAPGGAIAVLPGRLVAVGSDGSDAVVWVATPEK